MANTYITPFEYKRATTGQEITSLLGNLLRLSSGVSAAGVSLPVTPNTTVNLAVNDPVWIFDGVSSEMVTVTATTNAGASSIPVTALAYNHAGSTALCSDGTNGSLGQAIESASIEVENICRQPLLQATYTEELQLRTMAASINSDGALAIRPRHFPVQSISALSLGADVATMLSYDATQAIIPSNQRRITVPTLLGAGGSSSNSLVNILPPFRQTSAGYVQFTYVAGFTYASLPWDIKQACIWLTSNLLSDRINPTGSAEQSMGQIKYTAFLRGDTSGESALYKKAIAKLVPYTRTI
jgi:hypothetical protein